MKTKIIAFCFGLCIILLPYSIGRVVCWAFLINPVAYVGFTYWLYGILTLIAIGFIFMIFYLAYHIILNVLRALYRVNQDLEA